MVWRPKCLKWVIDIGIGILVLVAALAYIGEKSHGISPSLGIWPHPYPPRKNFSPSRGFLKMAPKHDQLDQRLKRTIPHPLHENISPSRGIPWDEEKWGEALTILKIADHTPPPPWEHLPHLVGSHKMGRNGEKLSPFWKWRESQEKLDFFKIQCKIFVY